MSFSGHPRAPLYVIAKELCGDKYFTYKPPLKRATIAWTNALFRWYQLNRFMLDNDIEKHLPPEHFQSFRFLREWWTAQYQPPEVSLVSRLKIEKASDEILAQLGEEAAFQRTLEILDLVEKPSHDVCVDDIPLGERAEGDYRKADWDTMTYSGMMENLFIYELFEYTPYIAPPDGSQPNMLDNIRHQSALRVYCQQLSMARFRQLEKGLDAQVPREQMDDEKDALKPENLLSGFQDLALSPWREGPLVKSCRWLAKPELSRPHYLWDCHLGKTIETRDIDNHPEYTVVSHTWGRWKIFETDSDGSRQQVFIDIGGVPWPVPLNSRFNVSELPQSLEKLKDLTHTRYIWIDLLCIPQAYSTGAVPVTVQDFARDQVTKDEIGRQAEIFRNSKHAVAWFSDVEDFECLSSVLNWFTLDLLKFSPGSEDASRVHTAREAALVSTENKRIGLLESWRQLNSWFTSLWTLQELCLRPDMWMCSRDWSFASVIQGQPISFRAIHAIWSCWQNAYEESIVKPAAIDKVRAILEFRKWIYTVGLEQFDALSPVAILAFGEKRVCTRRRAEAIMSALGTTKWYETLPSAEHEKDLVLDKYPLAFINELKDVDPGNFFCYLSRVENEFEHPEGQADLPPDFRRCQGRGTMLPFSPDARWYNDPGPLFNQFPCHGSIRSWTISIDGSVHISKACILVSKSQTIPSPLSTSPQRHLMHASLNFVTEANPSTTIEDSGSTYTDLEAWICSRAYEAYAVVVTHRVHEPTDTDEGRSLGYNGVILGRVSGAEMFVNLGMFLLARTTMPLPETVKTNWTVA